MPDIMAHGSDTGKPTFEELEEGVGKSCEGKGWTEGDDYSKFRNPSQYESAIIVISGYTMRNPSDWLYPPAHSIPPPGPSIPCRFRLPPDERRL
jgi:hypothetical protein